MAFFESSTTLSVAAAGGFLAGMAISGTVTHGLVRTFLAARGIADWSLRDTIGSSVLVLLGGGALGAALVTVLAAAIGHLALETAGGLVLLVLGAFWIRLGLLALRKLV